MDPLAITKVEQFSLLHQQDEPLILYNIWDAASAKIAAAAGAKAVATGSMSLAGAQGYDDGEHLPFEQLLTLAANIVRVVNVPVTIDLESGYGGTSDQVGDNARRLFEIGICGINLEDQDIAGGGLRDIADAARRVRAAADSGLLINARTDLFIQTPPQEHDAALVAQALERCRAYADAGAQCFFIPLVSDEKIIAEICEKSVLPVNCMVIGDTISPERLHQLGVARISYGPGPWRRTMASFGQAVKEVYR